VRQDAEVADDSRGTSLDAEVPTVARVVTAAAADHPPVLVSVAIRATDAVADVGQILAQRDGLQPDG